MSKYWSPFVHQLVPYVPGEQAKLPGLVKLNTNENPYGPSPAVLAAIRAELGEDLRRYPDPTSGQLVEAAARYFGLAREQIFVGNGSDEVLAHIFHGLLKHDQPVLFPDVSYSFYPVYCRLFGIPFETVALDDSFQVELDDYCRANGGVVLPNPNAPTGVALPTSKLERLLESNQDSVVVVDEAYVDFGAESAVGLISRYPQLVVVQTFSKSRSLAGLRVGLAMAQPELIEALVRVKDSFNSYPLDRLAIAGASAALEDRGYFEQTRAAVIESRGALTRGLEQLDFEVLPSSANFVFARHRVRAGDALARALRARSILVRHFSAPRIEQFLRITVGVPEDNDKLLLALRQILQQPP